MNFNYIHYGLSNFQMRVTYSKHLSWLRFQTKTTLINTSILIQILKLATDKHEARRQQTKVDALAFHK